jgi:hypothetical protein
MTNNYSSKYTSIVGTKFNKDGLPRRYLGNTIICSIETGSEPHNALKEIQSGLKSTHFADSFVFLPSSSFHMTLIRGANDQLRLPNEWPKNLDLDMELQEVTSHFCSRLANFLLPDSFIMSPKKLGNSGSGESQLFLEPHNEVESRKIESATQSLRHALKHSRTGDGNYTFHITFSYQIKHLSLEQTKELHQYNATLFNTYYEKLQPLKVLRPTLCDFENMLKFKPILELSNR